MWIHRCDPVVPCLSLLVWLRRMPAGTYVRCLSRYQTGHRVANMRRSKPRWQPRAKENIYVALHLPLLFSHKCTHTRTCTRQVAHLSWLNLVKAGGFAIAGGVSTAYLQCLVRHGQINITSIRVPNIYGTSHVLYLAGTWNTTIPVAWYSTIIVICAHSM